jgi:hypothetical protein
MMEEEEASLLMMDLHSPHQGFLVAEKNRTYFLALEEEVEEEGHLLPWNYL